MKLDRGHYKAMAAGVCWGTSGLLVRNLLEAGFTPLQVAAYRTAVTAVLLAAIILYRDRNLFRVKKGDISFLVIFGMIGIALGYICSFYSIKYTTLAIATILTYTSPIYTTLLSPIFFKERLYSGKIIGLVMLITGCFLLVKAYDSVYLHLNFLGILFGLGAGLCTAVGALCAKKVSGNYNPIISLFYTFGSGGVLLLVAASSGKIGSISYTVETLVSMVLLIAVPTLGAFFLYMEAVKSIEVSQAGACAMVEPIVAAALGFIFFGEILDRVQLSGALIMIAGVMVYNRQGIRLPQVLGRKEKGEDIDHGKIENCS